MLIAGICHLLCVNRMNDIAVVHVKRASVAREKICFVLCALGCIGMRACVRARARVCVFVIRQ
jgi:hypothetical protein